ncbi:hypothetical protein KR009_010847 [Drosophila setifemur]|nr:hypothetical protein KR009_010847 [Drosophila setifemur]
MSFIHPDATLMASHGNVQSSMEESEVKSGKAYSKCPSQDRMEITIVMLKVQVID